MGAGKGRCRRGNSQRHATRARHTRALQSSIHVAILLRIFSSCSYNCRCICECICHCHCICICTCSCVSICACILHFSFNYVHLNPRPIRIFHTFVACNVVAARLRDATVQWQLTAGSRQIPALFGCCLCLCCCCLCFFSRRSPSLVIIARPSPASSLVCLFSLASRQVDSTQLTCVRVCRTRSGECGVYLRCRATCHILCYLPQTVLPYPGH